MSAKSFFKKSVPPRLFQRFSLSSRCTLEIWTTTCIVTNFDAVNCKILVNPSNPQLSGVSNFPYFPRGGPVPLQKPSSMHKDWQPLGFVSQWGGMEVGTGMLYPVSVIDGLVHLHGGYKLRLECQWHRWRKGQNPCPVGSAVVTGPGSLEHYQYIVHTTPPFYLHDTHPLDKLEQCYQAALDQACNLTTPCRVALPLLGSGARGFPYDIATQVAARASVEWCRSHEQSFNQRQTQNDDIALVFGLLEEKQAEQLAACVHQVIKQEHS